MYRDKLDVLVDLTTKIYSHCEKNNLICDIVYVDGGECTGTTTAVSKICEKLPKSSKRREPSQECKDTTLKEFFENGSIINPSEYLHTLLNIFLTDRKVNQANTKKGTITVSDRGIFSTIIYQSGILDTEISIDDVRANCNTIFDEFVKMGIKIPKLAINLISVDGDHALDTVEFKRRLDKRTKNDEQDLDNMDNVIMMNIVNKVYSDLSLALKQNTNIQNLIVIDFKCSIDDVVKYSLAEINSRF